MIRRLAFIPFEMQLEKIDVNLETTLKSNIDNLRYIMTGGIFAYRKAIEQNHLTEISKQKDLLSDFLDENKSPIDLFYDYLVQEYGNGDTEQFYRWINGETTDSIYEKYEKYREPEKNIEIQKTFTGRFKRKLPTKIELKVNNIGGTSVRTYTLKE